MVLRYAILRRGNRTWHWRLGSIISISSDIFHVIFDRIQLYVLFAWQSDEMCNLFDNFWSFILNVGTSCPLHGTSRTRRLHILVEGNASASWTDSFARPSDPLLPMRIGSLASSGGLLRRLVLMLRERRSVGTDEGLLSFIIDVLLCLGAPAIRNRKPKRSCHV